MKQHPILTYIYVYFINILAIIISIFSMESLDFQNYDLVTTVNFMIWTLIIVIARSGGFFKIKGLSGIMIGWAVGIEFACLLFLPFELYVISILLSVVVIFIKRVQEKHPEPFLGPDFNGANLIISGYVTISFYKYLSESLSASLIGPTLVLILSIITYMVFSIALLTGLIAIDLKKNFFRVGTFDKNSIISSAMLVSAGGLIGYIHKFDPFIILFLIIPLYFLHNSLNKISESKLIYLDEKTGLYNYRYFDEKLKKMFEQAQKNNIPLSIIFGDMDYLRDINNNFGHPVGDKAIIAVGNVFKEQGENYNHVAARFGGEEFILIVPKDKASAKQIAEKIRQQVKQTYVLNEDNEEIYLSISLGVASYPDDAKTMEELIKNSDDALYFAKNLGRNQVQTFHQARIVNKNC